jgi:methyltransferase-like protein/2-polyprenyl-3-methyl-5-hydroxy-6-metoxy-1,4-benzoquinol methylase
MSTPLANAYDTVPYESRPFPQSHPNHLATLARLMGMSPPPVERCRVLELGCASGGNLMPMAVQFPDSQFLGIDLSGRQIATGQAAIAELGLGNVELRQMDITAVDDTLGTFDYIIAHGVFSWVPIAVQDKVLAICNRNLASNGVAFVSYNTYPGWRMRGMIRDAMVYHANQFADPTQQVKQARALIDFFAQHVPTENNPFGILLKQELEDMRRRDDWYLAHEHLENVNEPIYFHQFVERASANGLQFLAEAEFSTMLASNFPPSVAETLRMIAPDVIRMEQYMDFLRNRVFRQTLLVHDSARLNRNLSFRNVAGLYVDSSARPLGSGIDLNSSAPEKFQSGTGPILTTPYPITKAALTLLADRFPQSMRIEELYSAARAHLDSLDPAPQNRPTQEADVLALGTDMLQCFAAGILALRSAPFRSVTEPGAHPRANALARRQAKQGSAVTNLRQEPLNLDEFNRQLVMRLDGQRDRTKLVDELVELVKSGVLGIQQEGKRVNDAAEVRETITKAVDQNLAQLGRVAMLEE